MDERSTRFAVGLTGGIGSGKSMVADLFAARGVAVIDTDQIAHSLTAPAGAAMPAIRAAFGPGFVTPEGALDRRAMRDKVFANPAARHQLEAILHPMITSHAEAAANLAAGPYLLFVVPLLVQSGRWKERVDRVLVVDCSEEEQAARVMRRNGLPRAQVEAIMAAQSPRAARLAAADDVIVNDRTPAALDAEVERLHASYMALAAAISKK